MTYPYAEKRREVVINNFGFFVEQAKVETSSYGIITWPDGPGTEILSDSIVMREADGFTHVIAGDKAGCVVSAQTLKASKINWMPVGSVLTIKVK